MVLFSIKNEPNMFESILNIMRKFMQNFTEKKIQKDTSYIYVYYMNNLFEKSKRIYNILFFRLIGTNKNATINMHYEMISHKIKSIIANIINSLEIELDNMNSNLDTNMHTIMDIEINKNNKLFDYISTIVLFINNNISRLLQLEKERLYNLTNVELCSFSDEKIIEKVYELIDNVLRDFNRAFYREKFNKRFLRQSNSIIILKVSEEIGGNVWNVIEPWTQKCCVVKTFMGDIKLIDIEKEFMYYPNEETINYLTGDYMPCFVFPRTGLAKTMKVISSAKIRHDMIKMQD